MLPLSSLGRMLINAAVRRALWRSPRVVLLVAVLLGLALMSIGSARALVTYPNQGAAYAGCQQAGQATEAYFSTRSPYYTFTACTLNPGATPEAGIYTVNMTRPSNGASYTSCQLSGHGNQCQHRWTGACPANAPWDPATNTCLQPDCQGGAIRMANGQCSATPEECSDLNKQSGFGVLTTKPFRSRCLANGCMFAMNGPGSCTVVAGNDSGMEMCTGEFTFTGATCGGPPPGPHVPGPTTPEQARQNTPQECVKLGGGSHDYCVKSNGDHCMTSAKGRQMCWQPGETGTKTDGPVAQVRNAGTNPNAPNPDLPNGDTLQGTGESATATTTRGTGSGSTTVTTTTTNYTTVHGTNAGPKNQGEKDDGSGSGKESDDDKNTASGGEDCERKPIVSDPAFEMIANQAWATRCAVEAGNAAKVTGDVGDCSAPYTVEGENANAEQLRALRVQICGDQPAEWDAVGDAIAAVESAAGEGDPSDAFSDGSQGGTGTPGGDGELDTGGFGYGNSCPQLPSINVMGITIDFNVHAADMCRWIQLAGQIVLVLAALASLRIIASGGQ